jgi:hypothetical protein
MQIAFTDPKLAEYKRAMEDNFPLFRMFLTDEVDAIIMHFLSTEKMLLRDIYKLDKGLLEAVHKIAVKYPNKIPKKSSQKVLIPKVLDYENENLNYHIVSNLTHMLIHLKAVTSTILTFIDKK